MLNLTGNREELCSSKVHLSSIDTLFQLLLRFLNAVCDFCQLVKKLWSFIGNNNNSMVSLMFLISAGQMMLLTRVLPNLVGENRK